MNWALLSPASQKAGVHSSNLLLNGSGVYRIGPKQVLKAKQKFHEEVAQMPMASTPVTILSAADHTPVALGGVL